MDTNCESESVFNTKIPQLDGNNSYFSSESSSDDSCSELNSSISSTICDSLSSETSLSVNKSLEASWFSQSSFLSEVTSLTNISVIIGHRPGPIIQPRGLPVRHVIRRDNKCFQALSMPTTLVYNMRSIWSKLSNFSEDMIERTGDICFISEVWEKSESKKHQSKIEEILEMKGISYISTPRPGARRGGGAGIAFNLNKNLFTLSKLNITIPKPLEVVWGLLRPIE